MTDTFAVLFLLAVGLGLLGWIVFIAAYARMDALEELRARAIRQIKAAEDALDEAFLHRVTQENGAAALTSIYQAHSTLAEDDE